MKGANAIIVNPYFSLVSKIKLSLDTKKTMHKQSYAVKLSIGIPY